MIILDPTRTATLEPMILTEYKSVPLTFKQKIKRMELGYHAIIIGLHLLQAALFAIGVTILVHGDEIFSLIFK